MKHIRFTTMELEKGWALYSGEQLISVHSKLSQVLETIHRLIECDDEEMPTLVNRIEREEVTRPYYIDTLSYHDIIQ